MMLVLPEFGLLKRQPKVPHVARTVVKRDWPNEYGKLITYAVRQSRNKKDWWLSASLEGWRASDTLHTSVPSKAAEWIQAVETGQISVGEKEPKTKAQLDHELDEAIAQLKAKTARRR